MRLRIGRLLMVCLLVATSSMALSADGIESRPLQFAKGTSSATVKGSLKGDKIIDYKLRAKAGQNMSVTLKTSNGANYFNVLPPGSTGEAIVIGSTSGNEWTGPLPADGEYTVRVYLMRSAARRSETADYTLTVGLTGAAAASAALGNGSSRRRQGQGHAVPRRRDCSMFHGERASEFAAVRLRCHPRPAWQCRGPCDAAGRVQARADLRRWQGDRRCRHQSEDQQERRHVVGRRQRPRALPNPGGSDLRRLIERSN